MTTATRIDLEHTTARGSAFNKPAYRYIRESDRLPAIHAGDGVARVKLFNPTGAATWWIAEYDPDEHLAYGLADLGMGCPELGYISMIELVAFRGSFGLPIERDLSWKPRPLTECLPS